MKRAFWQQLHRKGQPSFAVTVSGAGVLDQLTSAAALVHLEEEDIIFLNGTMQKALGATFSSGSHSLMWVALAHHNSTLMLWRCVCRVVGKVLGENVRWREQLSSLHALDKQSSQLTCILMKVLTCRVRAEICFSGALHRDWSWVHTRNWWW